MYILNSHLSSNFQGRPKYAEFGVKQPLFNLVIYSTVAAINGLKITFILKVCWNCGLLSLLTTSTKYHNYTCIYVLHQVYNYNRIHFTQC